MTTTIAVSGPAPVGCAPVPLVAVKDRLTRKKNGTKPPRPRDSVAWLNDGNGGNTLFFRSPLHPHNWITEAERKRLIEQQIARGLPFMRPRRGYELVETAYEGQIAFFKPGKGKRRQRVRYRNGQWVLDLSGYLQRGCE